MRRLLALLLAAAAARAGGDELRAAQDAVAKVAADVRPSVVTVITPSERDFDLTGCVAAPGVILTVRSPLLNNGRLPETLAVRFPGKRSTFDAQLLDEDPGTDTALYRATGSHARALSVARAADVHHGMWVLLVGNAFGQGRESTPTLSLGVISAVQREGDEVAAFHLSALLNPGSFGAPVVDLTGDLVGIAAAAITPDGQQTVVIPYDRIREAYRARGGRGASVVGRPPPPRRPRNHIADLLGPVLDDAAAQGSRALVGVRALARPEDEKPAEPAEGEEKKPRGPPPPVRVPGAKAGWDRSSGLVIDGNGLILCPLRITGWPGPRRELEVDLPGGQMYAAEVVGTDERVRLALLRVKVGALQTLERAPAETLRPGRLAIALGYPHAAPDSTTPQLTFGIVSRTNALSMVHPAFQALQTDAAVSASNRGGPLVDTDGRLMGILVDVDDADIAGYMMKARGRYAGNAGIGFAVPWPVLDRIVPRLAKGENLRAGFLGVSTMEGPDGLRIVEVVEKNAAGVETGAHAAGLLKDDLILGIGREDIRTGADLRRVLGAYGAGDRLKLRLRRAGKDLEVEVTLGGQ